MSGQERGEPITLEYAAGREGRFESLSRSEPDVDRRRAGLKLWAEKYVANAAYCLQHGINVSGPLAS